MKQFPQKLQQKIQRNSSTFSSLFHQLSVEILQNFQQALSGVTKYNLREPEVQLKRAYNLGRAMGIDSGGYSYLSLYSVQYFPHLLHLGTSTCMG